MIAIVRTRQEIVFSKTKARHGASIFLCSNRMKPFNRYRFQSLNSPLTCDWLQQQWSFRRFSLWQYLRCSLEQGLQLSGVLKSLWRMCTRLSRACFSETSWSLKYSTTPSVSGRPDELEITRLLPFAAAEATAPLKSQISRMTAWKNVLLETIMVLWSFILDWLTICGRSQGRGWKHRGFNCK